MYLKNFIIFQPSVILLSNHMINKMWYHPTYLLTHQLYIIIYYLKNWILFLLFLQQKTTSRHHRSSLSSPCSSTTDKHRLCRYWYDNNNIKYIDIIWWNYKLKKKKNLCWNSPPKWQTWPFVLWFGLQKPLVFVTLN